MVEARQKQVLIDGKPVIILCGELHYFRLARGDWKKRIAQLKSAGCNAVASYVPWLCHEPVRGAIDLAGSSRPELDLGAFIDLCGDAGLWFFVRPGPFIMAEMKNEGIPYWVAREHPAVVPVTWDGRKVTTKTLDYLHPAFLAATRDWYRAVDAVVAPRTQPNGGPVIAYQVDNEIGMLSWVTGSPDLTDGVLADLAVGVKARFGAEGARARYPFDLDDPAARAAAVRSPSEAWAGPLMQDIGRTMRARFTRYAAALRAWAEEDGIRDIPFVINVHGTSGGRGFTFPIGISQLYESWAGRPGWISGTDIYLGNLTMDSFQDLYVLNAFTDAANGPDQPLTSVEFESGDGNYGQTLGGRYDVSAVDFKTRMCVAQGARLLNYYLFAGGRNYRLEPAPGDGNDRVAFTGERHGFAAPISPEGTLNYTWPRMVRSIKAVAAVDGLLAAMEEERDGFCLGFIPDYWMTESRYPGSRVMAEMCSGLEQGRGFGAWEIMVRALLAAGYRFGARNIQDMPLDPATTPVLALGAARYMSLGLQQKIGAWLRAGGRLLLYGEVPTLDMDGRPCTALADAVGARPAGLVRESDRPYLSVCAEGWAAPRPEMSSGQAQVFAHAPGETLLRVYGTGQPCGFDAPVGTGRVIVLAAAYGCDVPLFRAAMERLDVVPGLTHDSSDGGIFMTSCAGAGGRFIHVINLDGFAKQLRVSLNGRRLFGGARLALGARDAVMLPVGVARYGVTIAHSTAEIMRWTRGAITFRLTQARDVIVLEGERRVAPSPAYTVERSGTRQVVRSRRDARLAEALTVALR
jgi:beta-galactosidase